MRPVETSSATTRPDAVAHEMGELGHLEPAARRLDLDRVAIDAAHRPGRAAGDQRAADMASHSSPLRSISQVAPESAEM